MTLDGQTGWVAADYVMTVDPTLVAMGMPGLEELMRSAGGPLGDSGDLQARVVVGTEGSPVPGQTATATPTLSPAPPSATPTSTATQTATATSTATATPTDTSMP